MEPNDTEWEGSSQPSVSLRPSQSLINVPSTSTSSEINIDSDDEPLPEDNLDDYEVFEVVDLSRQADRLEPPTASQGPLNTAEDVLQQQAALFLAGLKENKHTTQTAIDEVVKGVNNIFKTYNDILLAKVLNLSKSEAVQKEDIKQLFDFMQKQNIFEGIHNKYRLDKYEEAEWIGSFKPVLIVLTWKRIILHGRVKEVPDRSGYSVPFLTQLQSLLQSQDALDCIDNPMPTENFQLKSALDGSHYKFHPVVLKHPKALGFILYVDDASPTEILSSYQEQGLRSYTWTLANIYPELRSSLRAINPLALVKSKVAKIYKNEPFLRNFIEAMNRLSSDEGVTFFIKKNGRLIERVFHGFLLFVVGDYPASSNIGGFKESAAKAKRPCRHCMVSQCDLHCKSDESEVTLRTAEMHAQQIMDLRAHHVIPLTEEEQCDENLEDSEDDQDGDGDNTEPHINLSAEYGINFETCLLKLTYFNISISLPEDIMHLFFEGILEIECRLLLQNAVEKKMKLKNINAFLESHHYGDLKTDKPSPIEVKHLKSGLRQNSSQMLMLSSLLPFIVRDHCDKAKLKSFILQLMILGLCMSSVIAEEEVKVLQNLIKEYLINFNYLYPSSMVPKHHFLIHLPAQILSLGPATEQWAMRFEAFHSRLKRLTKIIHCAKNLAFSLISRLLRKRALEFKIYGDKFLTSETVCAKTAGETKVSLLEFKESLMSVYENLQEDDTLSVVQKLSFYGSSLYPGAYILTGEEYHQLPLFGAVCKIYCHDKTYLILYRQLLTVGFCPNLNAYEVKLNKRGLFGALNITNLRGMNTLIHIKNGNSDYIALRQNRKPQFESLNVHV